MNTGKKAKSYRGDRPCMPPEVLLAIAQLIWRKRQRG